MSANNVVWVMYFLGKWHVFYSGCFDNTPKEPDYKDKYYKSFQSKDKAILYGHKVVDIIDEACAWDGYIGVEYGVCIVPREFEKHKPVLDALAKYDETVTKKDIEDFVNLVTEMVERLDKKLNTLQKTKPAKRNDGCYQFTYCNECLAYPMGLGCPNIVKGPVQLKDEVKKRK